MKKFLTRAFILILIGLVGFLSWRDYQQDQNIMQMKADFQIEVNRLGVLEKGLNEFNTQRRKENMLRAAMVIEGIERANAAMGGASPNENEEKNVADSKN